MCECVWMDETGLPFHRVKGGLPFHRVKGGGGDGGSTILVEDGEELPRLRVCQARRCARPPAR
jgi:hypothetical protein